MPRSRHRVIAALVAGLVIVAAVVVIRHSPSSVTLSSQAAVSASSVAGGSSARDVLTQEPGHGWTSGGETTGAWVELSWPRSHDLSRIVIIRDALDQPGVLAGFLSFDNGSQIQVVLSTTTPTTTVPITARPVERVRFTVSAASPQAQSVTLDQIQVETAEAGDGVATDTAAGGNVSPLAAVTTGSDASGGDGGALVDGDAVTRNSGQALDVAKPTGAWMQLDWSRPRELATIEVAGDARAPASLRSATLTFSDGSTLPIGAVVRDPERPTIVSFMPRVTRSVRLTIDTVSGSGALGVAEIRAFQLGAPPRTVVGGTTPEVNPGSPSCSPGTRPNAEVGIVVSCPITGAEVGDRVRVAVAAAPEYKSLRATVWSSDLAVKPSAPSELTAGTDGSATFDLDLTGVPPGPLVVHVEARGARPVKTVFFQLYRTSDGPAIDNESSEAARGRTLTYAEEFARPLSISRTGEGADYAAAKPVVGGVEDFGAAIFADPALGLGNVQVVDDRYLQISADPRPADLTDPQGWGRDHTGGLLASARPGGSGFSAQYGYFETRMLTPAAEGTWSAFWMLSNPNLVSAQPVVAEVDAVEHYGHDPTAACHTTHDYVEGKEGGGGVARCGTRFRTEREAMAWHTYGVLVSPTSNTFYIDGREVAVSPQVTGGDQPLFFLLNLSLGGGWPIDLDAVQNRAVLYVDYVRVYV